MGQVWEAEQISLKRRVALKLVRPDRVSRHALELFSREARAGGRLQHPGIVAVFAHGESEGVTWIAMELVKGGWTLTDSLNEASQREELSIEYYQRVAGLTLELADSMRAAHDAGVVHRDLKPSNILITPEDSPKITDFGLAKITDETAISQSGEVAGTFAYMSPEQISAALIDHRTDVFSLGVILYELLTLQRPFWGDTFQQISRQILTQDPPDAQAVRSQVPVDLAVICGKCLEKDRNRRYATMAELVADIRRHVSNEPIHARPPSRLRKMQLLARRNPVKTVAGAVAALAFLAISVLLVENMRTVDERDAEIASVKRLSALQDFEDLIAEADKLWPPHPQNITPFRQWIEDAALLVAETPLHYAKRDELRALALLQTAKEREADRRGHADFGRLKSLRGEIAFRRAALRQRREGVATEEPELEWGSLPTDAIALNGLAWPLVKPDREVFGREGEGLVLARRALELAEAAGDDALVATVSDTVSRALFALGRDDEALEVSREALEVAPVEKREEYEGYLSDLEAWVEAAGSEEELGTAEEEITRLETEREDLEARVDQRQTWRFPETEEGREARWWHANLTKLIESLEGLQNEETGLLSEAEGAVSEEHGWSVRRRLRFAERVRDGVAEGGEWDERWVEAIAAIRGHAKYWGLELARQTGLVPIGADPDSGLWEFWHVATGEEPTRDEDGRFVLTEEMGLVLVLIPGGSFWMGATVDPGAARNYDPGAVSIERPVHEVELSAYLLSKYEMTQGQWLRATGREPSLYKHQSRAPSLLHPVEMVLWSDCRATLERMGLALPSEAQWENGCRAGTSTAWWFGQEREGLRGKINIADKTAADGGALWTAILDWPDNEDGGVVHREVGSYPANAFGLHEVHGNVWEWCLDGFDRSSYGQEPVLDPVSPPAVFEDRVARGGSFVSKALYARSASRSVTTPGFADGSVGVRPARAITK